MPIGTPVRAYDGASASTFSKVLISIVHEKDIAAVDLVYGDELPASIRRRPRPGSGSSLRIPQVAPLCRS
jgi:hypothetical protein